jgi:RNA polymerase sigma factor (sigma-70 family)
MGNEISKGRVDNESFNRAVLEYRERIFLVILRFVKNREDARDLTQEAFTRAYRSIGSFRGESGIYTWLYKIAINLAINYKARNRLSSFTSLEDNSEISGRDNPSEILLNSELGRMIELAITTLPTRQKAVFILHYYEEKPHAEIAEILGITEGAVKAHYHQAIMKLRDGLTSYLKAGVS